MRDQIAQRCGGRPTPDAAATDAELAKYIEQNKDSFNKSQVRASHILAVVEPDASPAEKEKARQKLVDIKKQIEAGKISFADAADKYLRGREQRQGEVRRRPRLLRPQGPGLEAFNAAAFALKKGEISDPVETDYGYHLILVTDRKEGTTIDPKQLLTQFKEQILNKYAFDLQAEIVAEQRRRPRSTSSRCPPTSSPRPPS